jgi:co-chaperonin GroES (HSP10)|tara:strand:+ start:99 stop:521 length:423 start_codon:yes stop_codon:yes gene_type:complete
MTLIKPDRFVEKDDEEILIPRGAKATKEYLDLIPQPVGYRILIRPYSGKKKTKGGIYLSEKTQETIQMTTVVGFVVKMGDMCYQDKNKFPTGPWCKEGQFVIYGRYSGARFKTKYGEHRILNDDEIIGTINKPEDILALF